MVRFSRVAGLVLLSAISTSGCGGQQLEPVGPKPARPTPAPRFREPIEKVPRKAILEYAKSLVFDSVRTVGDRQRLMIGNCPDACRYGPLVDIHPELGLAGIDKKALQAGRIIGRYMNHSPEAYAKLGIPANQASYVWVDFEGGSWRAFVVPSDERLPLDPRRIEFEEHGEKRWAQSTARWKWHDNDETAWFSCTTWGCCTIDP